MVKLRKTLGPGLLVTAAFVGPGTVTTASVAGARFGYALLWALLFSVLATIVLQEMSARLGLVTRAGLGEALRSTFTKPWLRWCCVVLVVGAIGFGNAAYEAGNIIGAAAGLEIITGIRPTIWAGVIGTAGAGLLLFGAYRVLEKILIALVLLMSLVFVATAVIVRPDVTAIFRGMFVPSVPAGSLVTVIALIGTTVVPYNLFLHASMVREKWSADLPIAEALRQSRFDTCISIALGGVITLAIALSAAACFKLGTDIGSAAAMAEQLQPLLGRSAKWFFAVGLFAAGLTSTIMAPLAAAYATAGAFGWQQDRQSWRFRAVWASVIVAGTAFAISGAGGSPVATILFAQVANGLILPVVAVFLLVVVNRTSLLGAHANGVIANLMGVVVVGVVGALGAWRIVLAIGKWLEQGS